MFKTASNPAKNGMVKLYVELLDQSVDGLLGQTTRGIAAVALERVINHDGIAMRQTAAP